MIVLWITYVLRSSIYGLLTYLAPYVCLAFSKSDLLFSDGPETVAVCGGGMTKKSQRHFAKWHDRLVAISW